MRSRKSKASITAVLLTVYILLFWLLRLTAFADSPQPTTAFYVNDYAGIFSSEESEELVKLGQDLYSTTGAQVVILTINSTNGEAISNYAVRVGRDWGVGSAGKNNGVLIVLSVDDRKVWVAVGYGLEGRLTDAQTGRLLDEYAVPCYKKDQFARGTKQLYYAIVNEVREEYGLETEQVPELSLKQRFDIWTFKIMQTVFTFLIQHAILILFLLTAIFPHAGGRSYRGGSSGGSSGSSGSSGGGGSFGGGGAGRSF